MSDQSEIYPCVKKARYDLEIDTSVKNLDTFRLSGSSEDCPLQICEEEYFNTKEIDNNQLENVKEKDDNGKSSNDDNTSSIEDKSEQYVYPRKNRKNLKSSARMNRANKFSSKILTKVQSTLDLDTKYTALSNKPKLSTDNILQQPLHQMILTPYELESLFYKYKHDGHFRDNPNLPPFVTFSSSKYKVRNGSSPNGNYIFNTRGNNAQHSVIEHFKFSDQIHHLGQIPRQNCEDNMNDTIVSSNASNLLYTDNITLLHDQKLNINHTEAINKSHVIYENDYYTLNTNNYRPTNLENIEWKYADSRNNFYNYSYTNDSWNHNNKDKNVEGSITNPINSFNGISSGPSNIHNTCNETNSTAEVIAHVFDKYPLLPIDDNTVTSEVTNINSINSINEETGSSHCLCNNINSKTNEWKTIDSSSSTNTNLLNNLHDRTAYLWNNMQTIRNVAACKASYTNNNSDTKDNNLFDRSIMVTPNENDIRYNINVDSACSLNIASSICRSNDNNGIGTDLYNCS